MDEHIRHRAVKRLEGEPSQVARTSADATEGHLGRSLRREASDKAVAQVASVVDVDVAHRVVVGPRKDREEVEVLRGSLHRVVRELQALSSCLAAPMGATSCPVLAIRWILEPASLSQKVTNAPERLLALVRPAFDLVLRRIRSLKRVQACGCKIETPRYAPQFGSRLHFKRANLCRAKKKQKKKKTRGPKKRGPRKKGKRGFLWQSLTSLEMQPGAKLRRISRGLYFAATRLHAAF